MAYKILKARIVSYPKNSFLLLKHSELAFLFGQEPLQGGIGGFKKLVVEFYRAAGFGMQIFDGHLVKNIFGNKRGHFLKR